MPSWKRKAFVAFLFHEGTLFLHGFFMPEVAGFDIRPNLWRADLSGLSVGPRFRSKSKTKGGAQCKDSELWDVFYFVYDQ